ncbi:hypothetical protein SMC26_18425 [Actinomadura fulvescens]
MKAKARLIGALALATAGVAVQVPAGPAQATIVCPIGYVCLQPEHSPSNQLILIKEGDRQAFPGGVEVAAVSNQTKLNYCVSSHPYNYGLAPRQQVVRSHTVLAVGPSNYCLT